MDTLAELIAKAAELAIYPDFLDEAATEEERKLTEGIFTFYAQEQPIDVLDFGQVKTRNTTVYSADFRYSGISVIHYRRA